MALITVEQLYSGTETVGTTEHSLTTDTSGPDVDTTDAKVSCTLDLSNLANGDTFQFRVYEKTLSGDTQRVLYERFFVNAQGEPNWQSPEFSLMHGWDMTLDKIAGTDRSITWSIRGISRDVNTVAISGTTQTAGDIPARLPAALVGGRMDSNMGAISGDATAADNLESYTDGTEFMPVDAYKPKFEVSGATLTVYKPDDVTTAHTKTLTTDPAADPVVGAD